MRVSMVSMHYRALVAGHYWMSKDTPGHWTWASVQHRLF